MAIPTNKTELLDALASTYQKLISDLEDISPARSESKTLPGHKKGTMMSVNDLIAYLIGWGELVLKWEAQISTNKKPNFPETGFKWTELGELAQKFYSDYNSLSLEERMEQFDRTFREIQGLIESKSNAELYQSKWYKDYCMGRMIQLNTSSPYKNARIRIRKWKKSKDSNNA